MMDGRQVPDGVLPLVGCVWTLAGALRDGLFPWQSRLRNVATVVVGHSVDKVDKITDELPSVPASPRNADGPILPR